MRITRDTLLKQAREQAKQLTAKDRGIMCVYVSGSLLMDDPFIGGITDIDLICVHDRPFDARREVIRLSPEITLDLAHYQQEEFEPARSLRTNAWIGGWLENVPIVLHDSMRWYDFTRASATAQIWRSENVAARVRSFLVPARKAWADLRDEAIPQGIKRTAAYLGALRDLGNAVACFSGAPLAERRLVHELPARANAARLPQLSADFVQLFTSNEVNDENFAAWVDSYHDLFDALKDNPNAPVSMQPFRSAYYEKAVRALYPNNPAGALWLMMYTWTQAASKLPRAEQPFKDWTEVSKQLDLDTKNIPQRLDGLDHLLDTVEEAADRISA